MTISAHHKIDKFLFSTVVPKLYKIELGENGNTINACKVSAKTVRRTLSVTTAAAVL